MHPHFLLVVVQCVSVEHDPVSVSRSNRIPHFRTESGLDWISKKLNRIRYGYPNWIDHCSKMLNQSVFLVYKPDWIKYLDRFTGIGSDRSTQRKFWTGLGFQKSPICSTLQCITVMNINQRSKLGDRSKNSIQCANTLKHESRAHQCYVNAVHNCKNTRLHIKKQWSKTNSTPKSSGCTQWRSKGRALGAAGPGRLFRGCSTSLTKN